MLLKHYSGCTVAVWWPSSQLQAGVAEMPGSAGTVEGGVGGCRCPNKKEINLGGITTEVSSVVCPLSWCGDHSEKLVGFFFLSFVLTSSFHPSHPIGKGKRKHTYGVIGNKASCEVNSGFRCTCRLNIDVKANLSLYIGHLDVYLCMKYQGQHKLVWSPDQTLSSSQCWKSDI